MVARGKDGDEIVRGWDGHVYTAIVKIDNQQGPTVQHRKLYSMFCNNLAGKRL